MTCHILVKLYDNIHAKHTWRGAEDNVTPDALDTMDFECCRFEVCERGGG